MKNINTPSLLTEQEKQRIESEERYRQQLRESKFCFRCGKQIDRLAGICPHCGVNQSSTIARTGKSKYVASLLAFFFGWLGAHKFYMNRRLQGILYLIFFWTFIPAVISFFEAIRFLAMDDVDFEVEAAGGL